MTTPTPATAGADVPPVPPDGDRALVARLIAGDSDAWAAVFRDIVTPLFRADIKGIASRCTRVGLGVDAVCSRLYRNLSARDSAPLRAFRFECAFPTWLYWQIWNAAQGAIREVAPSPNLTLSDPSAPEPPIQLSALLPDGGPGDAETANHLLARLWERNPVQALVLVLRHDAGLSSKEVGALLGKTPANVDQINHRAQKRMRELRDGISGGT